MNEKEYIAALRKVLEEYRPVALNKLKNVLKIIPDKATRIELMIFPDQDGEGTFSVRVSLSGPDLYILNKAINDHADLIDVKHTDGGLEPDVPLMDPFDSEFEVNDVLCDTVGEWLKSVWQEADNKEINIPVAVVSDEDYGTTLPIKLN